MSAPGRIVVLNGTPRSGKSSIAAAIQETFDGVWMNLGVDAFKAMAPARYQPGIGLRPGGEVPALEPLVAVLYLAMYQAVAAHSRLGLHVVVDAGHHDAYSRPRNPPGRAPTCPPRGRRRPARAPLAATAARAGAPSRPPGRPTLRGGAP